MKNYREQLSGVLTALVTPFQADGSVDFDAFAALVETQLAAGVAGLVPVGTTGEAATLSETERTEIIRLTVEITAGRAFVLAGTGSNRTETAVAWSQKAQSLGAHGCLVVTPYYNKPSQRGLVHYFDAIAEKVDIPLVLYSVPGRCGVEIAPQTAAALRQQHENVIGIKEAGGSVERVTQLRKACGENFIILSGDDGLTLPFLATGAIGVISVVSNVAPELMVALDNAWQRRDIERAMVLHGRVHDLAEALFVDSNPVPAKAALALMKSMRQTVRSPLVPLDAEAASFVAERLAEYQQYS